MDTSGLPEGGHETSGNDNDEQTQNLLENIKRAIKGKLPYDTNVSMLYNSTDVFQYIYTVRVIQGLDR